MFKGQGQNGQFSRTQIQGQPFFWHMAGVHAFHPRILLKSRYVISTSPSGFKFGYHGFGHPYFGKKLR